MTALHRWRHRAELDAMLWGRPVPLVYRRPTLCIGLVAMLLLGFYLGNWAGCIKGRRSAVRDCIDRERIEVTR